MNTRTNLPEYTDVVVIGGGIIGCSTAYYLARQGISVALCEKGKIGCEQSGRNWGFIRKQGRHLDELPLMIDSLRLWHELVADINQDIGFHVGGTLYLSETEKCYETNRKWLECTRKFDLDTRFLSKSELQELVPGIRNQQYGALYTPSDARAEPDLATRAIAGLAVTKGASVFENCAVRGVDIEAGRVAGIVTEHGRIKAGAAVCAGGAWSGYFCRHLDIRLPQLKVISSVMASHPTPYTMQTSFWSGGLGLRKRFDGGYNIAFGGRADCQITPDFVRYFTRFLPSYFRSKEVIRLKLDNRFLHEVSWPSKWSFERETPFERERILDPAPNHKLLASAYEQLGETIPALAHIGIANKWAGIIDVMPDELPVIDTVDEIPGLIIATGFSGHGFGIGPGAGKATADLVMGNSSVVLNSKLSFSRFA